MSDEAEFLSPLPSPATERTPLAVQQHTAMLERLLADQPIVPVIRRTAAPLPDLSDAVPKIDAVDVDSLESNPVVAQRIVEDLHSMSYNEMRDYVLSRTTPEELLALHLQRTTNRDKIKLKEGRISITIDVLCFTVNKTQILFYVNQATGREIKFQEGETYTFSRGGDEFANSMYLGSFYPSQNFAFPLMSFLRDTDDKTGHS